jgi:hypothetical protein
MTHSWTAPDGAHTVAFVYEVVSALRARVVEAYHALPKRGVEIGGLLLGKAATAGRHEVLVEGFEEIACDHRFGPSYVLSEEELARLDEAIARHGAQRVVGYFRSYTGRDAVLDDGDLNLFQNRFTDPRSVFLLLRPEGLAACHAAFVFWKDGKLPFEPGAPPFAFDASRMGGQPAAPPVDAPARVSAPVPPGPIAAAPDSITATADPTGAPPALDAWAHSHFLEEPLHPQASRNSPAARFWLPLAACVVLSVGSAIGFELWRNSPAPGMTLLPLDGHPTAQGFEVEWDGVAPAIASASRGVLSISDGTTEDRVDLAPAAIRRGRYVYQSSRPDVIFRLDLYGSRGADAAGLLRIIKSAPVAETAVAVNSANREAPAAPLEETAGSPVIRPPEILREVHPSIPSGIRARIAAPVIVPVDVRVSKSGTVIHAAAEDARGRDDVYQYLAHRAEEAAHRWRFSPARTRDGHHAEADKIIYFVFAAS